MSTGRRAGLGSPTLTEVADGVFAYVQPDGSWWINNTGLLVGRHAAVSIGRVRDRSPHPRLPGGDIRGVTGLPVRTLVNTHHHGDHTHGNSLFRDATIVAHERTRTALIEAGLWRDPVFWTPFDLGGVELEPPSLTYSDGVTLWVDEVRCEVRHVGRPAHTTNDSIVWIPEHSVLFTGDLVFAGGTPFVLMGSLSGSIQVLEEVVAPIAAKTIVPGHGEVCGSGPSRTCSATCASSGSWHSAVARPAWPRSSWPGRPIWVRTPTGTTPSASSATCTAPTPTLALVRPVSRSTSPQPWATWSPSTVASR